MILLVKKILMEMIVIIWHTCAYDEDNNGQDDGNVKDYDNDDDAVDSDEYENDDDIKNTFLFTGALLRFGVV